MAAALREKVLACEDRVPVLTGYFGTVPGGLMDGEIGRGYTDLCAALVAVGVKAEELQVWKEVDGIFTADPTKVPTARLLPTITPSEAAELTFYGSEVIHHLTMDQVIHTTPPIRIRIKNVKNPRGDGTIILPDPKLGPGQLSHSRSTSSLSLRKTPKRPTAVTIKDKISVINVHSNKRSISHGFFAKVFSILDSRQLSVDLISTSEVHVSMAIHSANLLPDEIEKAREELELCGEVSILNNMAILSLVGAEMKNMIGVAGRMFSTLGENNVNIEMISQGMLILLTVSLLPTFPFSNCGNFNPYIRMLIPPRGKRNTHILCNRRLRSNKSHEHFTHEPLHISRMRKENIH
jgi:aspartate kinase